jgi:hypothetical protein
MKTKCISAFLVTLLLVACGSEQAVDTEVESEPGRATVESGMPNIAEQYVRLVLSMGEHDGAYVDAYFGPAQWREEARAKAMTIVQIRDQAKLLQQQAEQLPKPDDLLSRMRIDGMVKRLTALLARIEMIDGRNYPFDEETRLLYDAVAPNHDEAHFQTILDQIEQLLPGDGPLAGRVEDFRQQFVIPPERLEAVFSAAIAECRRRSLQHIELPEGEDFTVEYVNDKPWSGYNWYQGKAISLIQVNTDLPIFIDRAIDLGCHEGYPGHHSYNAMLENQLVDQRGWVEYSVYPLFSPQSLIAEGSANYGIELAFPGPERVQYERETLFPMAGLDADQADLFYQLGELLSGLGYAGNEAARDYLDGRISRQEAIDWLVRYSLNSPERAAQRVDFFDTYRGYVINYNLGLDLVRDWVEREAGDDQARRWEVFSRLLSSPMGPNELR